MSQFLVLCAMMAVVFVQFAQAQLPVPLPPLPVPLPDLPLPDLGLAVPTVCPAGFFVDLLTCKPCPRGMTSIAGVLCIPCPSGSYAPSAGSPMCYACAAGYVSTPAGEACYLQSSCAAAKGGASKKGSSKRRLRDESDLDSEMEVEEEAESMFSF
jgi:hypothetical protein